MEEMQHVESSWVEAIGFWDDMLIVEFRDGFRCGYPGTTLDMFEEMLNCASPGGFVHAYLYHRNYVQV